MVEAHKRTSLVVESDLVSAGDRSKFTENGTTETGANEGVVESVSEPSKAVNSSALKHSISPGGVTESVAVCDTEIEDAGLGSQANLKSELEEKQDTTQSVLSKAAAFTSVSGSDRNDVRPSGSRSLKPCDEICLSEIEADWKTEDSAVAPHILRPKARFLPVHSAGEPSHPVCSSSTVTFPVNGAGDCPCACELSSGGGNVDKSDKQSEVSLTSLTGFTTVDRVSQNEKNIAVCASPKEQYTAHPSCDLKNSIADVPVSSADNPLSCVISSLTSEEISQKIYKLGSEGLQETSKEIRGLGSKGLRISECAEAYVQDSPVAGRKRFKSSSPTAFSSKNNSRQEVNCDSLDLARAPAKLGLDKSAVKVLAASGAGNTKSESLPVVTESPASPVPEADTDMELEQEQSVDKKPSVTTVNSGSKVQVSCKAELTDSLCISASSPSNTCRMLGESAEKQPMSVQGQITDRTSSVSPEAGSADGGETVEDPTNYKSGSRSVVAEAIAERPSSAGSGAGTALCSSPSSLRPPSTDSSTTIIMCQSPSGWRPASTHSDTAITRVTSEDMLVTRPSSSSIPLAFDAESGGKDTDIVAGMSTQDSLSAGMETTSAMDSVSACEPQEGSLSWIFSMFLEMPDPVLPLPPSPIPLDRVPSPSSTLLSWVSKSDRPAATSKQSSFKTEPPLSPVCEEPPVVTDPRTLFTEYKQEPFDGVEPVKSRRKRKKKKRGGKLNPVVPAAPPSNTCGGSGSTAAGPRIGVKVTASSWDANWPQSSALTPVEAAKRQMALRQQAAAKSDASKSNPSRSASQSMVTSAPPTLPAKRKSSEQLCPPSQPKRSLANSAASNTRRRVDTGSHSATPTQKMVTHVGMDIQTGKGAHDISSAAMFSEKAETTDSVSPLMIVTENGDALHNPVSVVSQEAEVKPVTMVTQKKTGAVSAVSVVTQKKADASNPVAMDTQQTGVFKAVSMVMQKGSEGGDLPTQAKNRVDKLKASPSTVSTVQTRTETTKAVPTSTKMKNGGGSLEEKVEDLLEQFCATPTMRADSVLVQLQQLQSVARCWLPLVHAVIKLLRQTEEDLQPVIIEACGSSRLSAAAKKKLSQQTFMAPREVRLLHLLLRLIESEHACDRKQLMECLWAAIFARETTRVVGQAALCRLFVGLCGAEGHVEEVRVLAYNVMRCRYLNYVSLTFAIAAAWPKALSRNGGSVDVGILTVMEHVIMTVISANPALAKIGLCFERLCGWVPSVQEPQHILARLVAELQLTIKTASAETEGRKFELCRAIELLCSTQEPLWVCSHFVDRPLRSAAMKWLGRGLEGELVPEYLITLFRVLGAVINPSFQFTKENNLMRGLEQFVYRQCRKILTCEHRHPEIEQSCAELLLRMAPFRANWFFSILHAWCRARTTSIPKEFHNRIIALGNTIKSRGVYLYLDNF